MCCTAALSSNILSFLVPLILIRSCVSALRKDVGHNTSIVPATAQKHSPDQNKGKKTQIDNFLDIWGLFMEGFPALIFQ